MNLFCVLSCTRNLGLSSFEKFILYDFMVLVQQLCLSSQDHITSNEGTEPSGYMMSV